MARADRADSMWLAENWTSLSHGDTTLTHPRRIREEYRDLQASKPPAPELDLSAPADPSLARIAAVMPVAAKVRKLHDARPLSAVEMSVNQFLGRLNSGFNIRNLKFSPLSVGGACAYCCGCARPLRLYT